MMEVLFTVSGVLGALIAISAYFLLERGVLSGESYKYYALNGFAAFLVLGAVIFDFDSGDAGAILQEVCWLLISLMGVSKILQKEKKNDQN